MVSSVSVAFKTGGLVEARLGHRSCACLALSSGLARAEPKALAAARDLLPETLEGLFPVDCGLVAFDYDAKILYSCQYFAAPDEIDSWTICRDLESIAEGGDVHPSSDAACAMAAAALGTLLLPSTEEPALSPAQRALPTAERAKILLGLVRSPPSPSGDLPVHSFLLRHDGWTLRNYDYDDGFFELFSDMLAGGWRFPDAALERWADHMRSRHPLAPPSDPLPLLRAAQEEAVLLADPDSRPAAPAGRAPRL